MGVYEFSCFNLSLMFNCSILLVLLRTRLLQVKNNLCSKDDVQVGIMNVEISIIDVVIFGLKKANKFK